MTPKSKNDFLSRLRAGLESNWLRSFALRDGSRVPLPAMRQGQIVHGIPETQATLRSLRT